MEELNLFSDGWIFDTNLPAGQTRYQARLPSMEITKLFNCKMWKGKGNSYKEKTLKKTNNP